MKKMLCAAFLLGTATAHANLSEHQYARIAKLEEAIAELKSDVVQEKAQQRKDGKAFRVPGTDQTVELILRPTLNVISDLGQRGHDNFDMSSIPLKDVDAQYRGKGGFSMTPAGTRLGVKTNHETAKGCIKSHAEIDFNGRSSSRITPRLRHAYIAYNQFLVGQTNTFFHDTSTMLNMADLSGVMNAPLRQSQIRIAHKTNSGLDLGLSFERPFTDVVYQGSSSDNTPSSTGTTAYTESPTSTEGVSTRGRYSQPTMPDAVVGIKYATPLGHIGVRGLVRQLKVKYLSGATNGAGSDYTAKKTGYGVGVSASVNMGSNLQCVGQYNVGRGMGRYIPDATGYSAYVDPIQKKMELIRLSHYLVGAKYTWTPDVTTNVMYQRINMTPTRFMSSIVNNWNKKIEQMFVNTFVRILPNTDVGLEYMYAERQAQPSVSKEVATPAQPKGAKGIAHRVQMMIAYTF